MLLSLVVELVGLSKGFERLVYWIMFTGKVGSRDTERVVKLCDDNG